MNRCNSPNSLKQRNALLKESRHALSQTVQEFKRVKNSSKQLADCHKKAAEQLLKWSLGENNRAIKDITFQFNELVCLWSDVQSECGVKFYDTIKQVDTIADTYKAVHDAEQKVEKFTEIERKLKNELRHAPRWRKGGDLRLMEQKVEQASRDRQMADKNYADVCIEQEAIKMLQFKSVLIKLAEIFLNAASSCTVIFEAQHDMAINAPDPTGELRDMRYSPAYAQERVETARAELAALDCSNHSSPSQHFLTSQNQVQYRRYSATNNSYASSGYASRLSNGNTPVAANANGGRYLPAPASQQNRLPRPRRSDESVTSSLLIIDPPPPYEQHQEAQLALN